SPPRQAGDIGLPSRPPEDRPSTDRRSFDRWTRIGSQNTLLARWRRARMGPTLRRLDGFLHLDPPQRCRRRPPRSGLPTRTPLSDLWVLPRRSPGESPDRKTRPQVQRVPGVAPARRPQAPGSGGVMIRRGRLRPSRAPPLPRSSPERPCPTLAPVPAGARLL